MKNVKNDARGNGDSSGSRLFSEWMFPGKAAAFARHLPHWLTG